MADGIVLGVLGLIPLCYQGYQAIGAVFSAPRAAGEALLRLELQKYVFDKWKESWTEEYQTATSNASAVHIFRQITAICALLLNARSLRKRYKLRRPRRRWFRSAEPNPPSFRPGQGINDVSIRDFTASCEANLNFLQRFRYAWSGDEKWKDLILLLREYNDNLYRLGLAGTPMLLAMTELPENRRAVRRLINAATLEVNSLGTEAEGYQQLLGVLRARFVHEPTIDECEHVRIVRRLHIRDDYYRLRDNLGNETATMAFVSRRGGEQNCYATLVEWTNRTEGDARKVSFLLKKLSSDLTLLPTSLGVAVDPRYGHGRAGVMLALPGGFGTFPNNLERGAITVERRPQNLEEMISGGLKSLSLRFRVAQKLASAVHTMHVIQYVHKNIRSSVILFFPRMDPNLEFPMITGFNHSHFRSIAEQPPGDEEAESHYSFSDEDTDFSGEAQSTGDDDVPPEVGGVPQQQDIHLDFYQHPDKRNDPTIHYYAHHDLYSLGCVLLEIGLWQTLRNCVVGIEDMEPNLAATRIRSLATAQNLDL